MLRARKKVAAVGLHVITSVYSMSVLEHTLKRKLWEHRSTGVRDAINAKIAAATHAPRRRRPDRSLASRQRRFLRAHTEVSVLFAASILVDSAPCVMSPPCIIKPGMMRWKRVFLYQSARLPLPLRSPAKPQRRGGYRSQRHLPSCARRSHCRQHQSTHQCKVGESCSTCTGVLGRRAADDSSQSESLCRRQGSKATTSMRRRRGGLSAMLKSMYTSGGPSPEPMVNASVYFGSA